MTVRDLIPWGRNRAPVSTGDVDPLMTMRREMNRLFEDFGRLWPDGAGTGVPLATSAWPQMDIEDGESEIRLTAELPGLDEKDIDVSLNGTVLTLRGEKRIERNGASPLVTERFHGRFQRSVDLGTEVEPDKVRASFKDGVLSVVAPKNPEAASKVRHIPIDGATTQ